LEPPDRTERRIRFGCGALFGVLVATVLLLNLGCLPWPWWLVVAVAIVGWCGYEAMVQGDRFWSHGYDGIRSWWWW
jgi:hypothetical protein